MNIKNSDCKNLRKNTIKKNQSRDVKECLLSEKLSNFEMLMLDIKNNLLYKRSKRGEIGRAQYDQRNLPPHIDRTFTTFGLSKKDPCTCADVIHGEYVNYLISDKNVEKHLPGSQINRGYKHPFNKYSLFGKVSNADVQGNKARKLMHYFEKDLTFKNINNSSNKTPSQTFYSSIKEIQKTKPSSIAEILREAPVNWKIEEIKKSLSHVNALRLSLKKRSFSVCFMDLYDHFRCIDKDLSCTVSLDIFYQILKQVNIKPNPEMFEFLLKEFNFITENRTVYYTEALNLLNWKCEFPSLFKIYDLPIQFQCYSTTYQDTMKIHQ